MGASNGDFHSCFEKRGILWCRALSIVVTLISGTLFASRPKVNDLCGVHLRSQAQAVQLYVEHHINHIVVCEVRPGFVGSTSDRANSEIFNGVPTIRVDSVVGVNETEVTHELFHLKLLVQGISLKGMRVPIQQTPREKSINSGSMYKLATDLHAYFQHRLFYESMAAMGLKPYEATNREVELDIKEGNHPAYARSVPEELAVQLLPFLDQPKAISALVEKWYRDQGWGRQVEDAITIHKIIEVRNPTTQAGMASTFQECWGILFPLV